MRAVLLLLLLWGGMAQAHPLAPALLELSETEAGRYEVLWRRFVVQKRGDDLHPVLPAACATVSPPVQTLEAKGALVERWTADCEADELPGSSVAIDGLTASAANVILRIAPLDGRPWQTLLDAAKPDHAWPSLTERPPAFLEYFPLGVEHLLLGYDHLLFLLALLLLLPDARRLVIAVTAFTLGHSITLALATLGLVAAPVALMEWLIAASILWLAAALAAGPGQGGMLARRPALLVTALGLLHGLGFASVLDDIGLPQDDLPLALLGFNLGIEAAQLAVVGAWLVARALLRRWPRALPAAAPTATAYAIGALAAWWCWERGAALLI